MLKATVVFEQIWSAINAKNEDGTRRYKYIINTGSSRSSKTFSILQSHWLSCLHNENKRISIWRETKADCKMTILTDLKKAIPSLPNNDNVEFNKTESIYKFKTGSTIEFMGGDEENRLHGFQGDIAHLNEPYNFTEEAFNQIDMRTSDYILIDWNPKANHWIDKLSKRENAIVIHSTYKDNPFVPEQQLKKILSYLPIKYTKVVKNGLITELNAKAYNLELNNLCFTESELNELKLAIFNESQTTANDYLHLVYAEGLKAEKQGRIYNWKPIDYFQYLQIDKTVYYGCDWGLVDPFAIVEVKYHDGNLYVHEVNYKSENEIRKTLTTTENHQINAQSDEGLVSWLFTKLNIPKDKTIVCDSNRPSKIIALRRSGWEYAISVGGKTRLIDRIGTMQSLNVYYTSTSKNLEFEQENYSYQKDRFGVTLEQPEDGNDHLINATEYITQKLFEMNIIKNI
jgi:PBSX family phage terminase large subunit